jgi:L-fucose mutarotase/ribose pyranase (RbsD/FucU family)
MRTIHFKNGETKEVSQEIIEILSKKESLSNFEFFETEKETYLIINTTEINYID